MDSQIKLQLGYMQAILRSEASTEAKLNELLPLRELLSGEVLGETSPVKTFVEDNWHQLSKILFFVRIYDVEGFHNELLSLLIRYTPRNVKKDTDTELGSMSA